MRVLTRTAQLRVCSTSSNIVIEFSHNSIAEEYIVHPWFKQMPKI